MRIAIKHDRQAFAPIIVPDTPGIRRAPIGMPDPISLNDLVRGTNADLTQLDGPAIGRRHGAGAERKTIGAGRNE